VLFTWELGRGSGVPNWFGKPVLVFAFNLPPPYPDLDGSKFKSLASTRIEAADLVIVCL
jgi:hypothetical protein